MILARPRREQTRGGDRGRVKSSTSTATGVVTQVIRHKIRLPSYPVLAESDSSIQEAQKAEVEMTSTTVQFGGKRKASLSTAPDLAADDPQSHKKMKQAVAPVHSRCSSRSRSSLQNLPLELLEIIFLYSANLALPRSCPSLGAKLSSKTTRLRFFMTGFHDTWDQYFGVSKSQASLMRMSDMKKWPNADISLQSDLLSMPWVDIDFILEAQQAWADKYSRGRCYRHYEKPGLILQYLYEENEHVRDRYMQHVRQHEEKTCKFDARACFEADYERAVQIPPTPEPFVASGLMGLPDAHPFVRPPVDLITGPWDEEKKRRLFWFVRAGINVEYDDKDCSEVMLACLDAAVISPEKPDPLIINCLIGDWILNCPLFHHSRDALAKLCTRIDRGVDTQDMRDFLRYMIRHMDGKLEFWMHYESEDEDYVPIGLRGPDWE
ncbi:hypothetical protein E4U30_005195 [Claviceps sp. LM220 group G6]|nr:hypothetical protein E4U30_005195 [Claviceps sp. LM220 group G6]